MRYSNTILTKNAERQLERHNFHENQIYFCLRDGHYVPIPPNTRFVEKRDRSNMLMKRHEHVHVKFVITDQGVLLVTSIFPSRYNFFYINEFVPKKHPRRINIENEVFRSANDIPDFSVRRINAWYSISFSERILCINEIQSIVNDRGCRYELTHSRAQRLEDCHLRRTSAYRKACDYLGYMPVTRKEANGGEHGLLENPESSPLGLLHEAFVLRQCIENNVMCPRCGAQLYLGGGNAAAWSDLCCARCLTFVEVKTKQTLPHEKINAGSYRWFHAQKLAGIHHYMIVVPKDGGDVHMYKIKHCEPRVDAKFLAYYNEYLKLRIEPTLRSKAILTERKRIFNVTNSALREQRYRAIAKQTLLVYFGALANRIKRVWRRFKTSEMDWEELYGTCN